MRDNRWDNRQEGALRILEAFSGVEEELLERSGKMTTKSSGRIWQRYSGAWAAVLVLAAAGAMTWGGYQLTTRVNSDSSGAEGGCMSAAQEEYAIAEEFAEGESGAGEAGAEAGAAGQYQDDYSGQNMDDNSVKQHDMTDGGSDMSAAESGKGGEEKPVSGELEVGKEQEEPLTEGAQEEAALDLDTQPCSRLNEKKYTLEEAKSQELVSSYLPENLPQGYGFKTARCNLDMEEKNLSVTWTRGMDSILWSVVQVKEAPETVDVEKPESYDERLYEIPHGETVPEEYRQSMDNPVFAWEDLSLEVVRSRMISYADSGDTSTPRGSFSVLYPDNIVVDFNGRGTAEEIWEMFCSMSLP